MNTSKCISTSQGLAAPRQATHRLAMHQPVRQQKWRSKRNPARHSVTAAAKGGGSSDSDVWKQLSSMADKYITNTTGQQQRPGADGGSCCSNTVLQNYLVRSTYMHAHDGCTETASIVHKAAMMVRYICFCMLTAAVPSACCWYTWSYFLVSSRKVSTNGFVCCLS
jgi:hypothetical protein